MTELEELTQIKKILLELLKMISKTIDRADYDETKIQDVIK